MVCDNKHILEKLIDEDYGSFTPPALPVLQIHSVGTAFPLCGKMVCVSDEQFIETATIPIEYFRDDSAVPFKDKHYIKKYTDLAIKLLIKFDSTPYTYRIEMSSSHENQPLQEELINLGYDVRIVSSDRLCPDELEEVYREYVQEEVGANIYYTPMGKCKEEIAKRYSACLEYGIEHCPNLIRTGMKSIQG